MDEFFNKSLPLTFIFCTLIWLIWRIFTMILTHLASKSQNEMKKLILNKFESNQAALAYMDTESGRQFIHSLNLATQPEPILPYKRILLSVQLGIVLVMLGAGLLFLHSRGIGEQPMFIFGTLAVTLGVGFAIAAAATYLLSRSFGLLESNSR